MFQNRLIQALSVSALTLVGLYLLAGVMTFAFSYLLHFFFMVRNLILVYSWQIALLAGVLYYLMVTLTSPSES
ncbi:hypothetical protein [Anthocerotibacter panamensis]|uniref:hypothetical protein n=1 Tax=Anthocerotibacter panamensis TaxID=2857077 RepID=UPI001C40345B|nr:hypothetical protein [Anthocerotibacter panamensis]